MNKDAIDKISQAQKIVIVQADNPDGDSVASALALEQILGDMGKEPILYCAVEIPSYLRYHEGWDRVVHELPQNFDLSIIVDTSSLSLLEILAKTGELSWIKSKPAVILDHHDTPPTIDFGDFIILDSAAATGEVIYRVAVDAGWPVNKAAAKYLASAILSDTLGLTTNAAKSGTVRVLAALLELGVNLAELDDTRRQSQKKAPEILAYKGRLIERIEYFNGQQTAIIHIPWEEIEKYSHAYNPSMLVLDEMRMVENVKVAIAFKTYPDGRITAKVRSNYGFPIAAKIAEHFEGGGHDYASGFRVTSGKSYEAVKSECIEVASKLISQTNK